MLSHRHTVPASRKVYVCSQPHTHRAGEQVGCIRCLTRASQLVPSRQGVMTGRVRILAPVLSLQNRRSPCSTPSCALAMLHGLGAHAGL